MKKIRSRTLTFDAEVDVEVATTVEEVYDTMDEGDIQEFMQYLAEDGYINPELGKVLTDSYDPWAQAIRKLAFNKVVLTLEEEQIILNIANKLP
jgi:hypothetical protein